MIGLRPIFYINGLLLLILAGMMLIPAMVDFHNGNNDWQVFFLSAFVTGAVGGGLYFSNYGLVTGMNLRQSFLLTASVWFILSAFGALPFMFSELQLPFADAFFEAASGLTTTGSTVIAGLDDLPPGILLWRSLMQGLGGIGVVVLAMAVLPQLGVGGMQLFRRESSDNSANVMPRARSLAKVIGVTYCSMLAMFAIAFWMAGMTGFDAVNHALTTISTGGYSTHDASLGYFDSAGIEIIAMLGMLAGALPLVLYYQLLQGRAESFLINTQVRWFLAIILVATLLLSGWRTIMDDQYFGDALRTVSFNVISIITTTGFATTDYNAWGAASIMFFFLLTSVGGCTGSTTGGIKIFRFQILYESAAAQLNRLIQPNGVFVPRYEGKQISPEILSAVLSFFVFYVITFTIGALLLGALGLDFLTAMSAVAQAIANVGPGLGAIVGPAGNYGPLPEAAKWILSILMIMGRLELFTVLVVLMPRFWRD